MTDYEPDWHQQDKDDRAQGISRDDAEPPEDGEKPLTLDVIEQLLDVVRTEKPFPVALRKALGYEPSRPDTPGEAVDLLLTVAVPQLAAQLRAAEEELAGWRSLRQRATYERAVTYDGPRREDGGNALVLRFDTSEAALDYAAAHPKATAYDRVTYRTGWEPIQRSPF